MSMCSPNPCPAEDDYQPFPTAGQMKKHMDLSLEKLRHDLDEADGTVYSYVVATVKNRGGKLRQAGSGPNIQGGLISLCTCKRYMRTFMDPQDWVGKWIAGFTTLEAGDRRNVLFYLMKVERAFCSYFDLWADPKISEETKNARAADRHILGDLYRPKNSLGDPFDFHSYVPPIAGHVHGGAIWHDDIHTTGCSGRQAALLIGDPEQSYLWERPLIYHQQHLHRGQKKSTLQGLLGALEVFK